MRIIEETPQLLKLRQRPYLLYFLGVYLVMTGLWALYTQVLTAVEFNGRVLAVVLLIIGLGLAIFLGTSATTITFDKQIGKVLVTRHSLVTSREKAYRLASIQQVTVYTGREFDPAAHYFSRTYHLLLMMKKGNHVQLGGGGKLQLSRLNDTAVHIQNFLKA